MPTTGCAVAALELFALASLALVAGVVSFSAPCTLPLLPGYVSYVSSLDTAATRRRTVWIGSLLFVAGFTAVFTVLGATAGGLGQALSSLGIWLDRIAGAVIVVMGLAMIGLLRLPALQRERRADLNGIRRGPAGALPLGAAFALGWTPCVGPVLASILALSAGRATVGRGALLLFVYAVGMSLPFLAVTLGVTRGSDRLAWLRRHARRIEVTGGVVLVLMGVLVASGAWSVLMSRALAIYARLGWPPI
jgi:cytochrome c-type biogenesis protein